MSRLGDEDKAARDAILLEGIKRQRSAGAQGNPGDVVGPYGVLACGLMQSIKINFITHDLNDTVYFARVELQEVAAIDLQFIRGHPAKHRFNILANLGPI